MEDNEKWRNSSKKDIYIEREREKIAYLIIIQI